jgi:hypothetical protein
MAGLVSAIHVLLQRRKKDVDGRHEAGHDVERADVRQFAVSRGCAMFAPERDKKKWNSILPPTGP